MSAALFIKFGPDIVVVMIALGLLWLALVAFQIGCLFMMGRAAFLKRWGQAVLWAVLAFVTIAAMPLYSWNEILRAEADMARAAIVKSLPDFTGKKVLYVPRRALDDISLGCDELVEMSGAEAVYLSKPWSTDGNDDWTVAPDLTAPIDLGGLIMGRAEIGAYDFGIPVEGSDALIGCRFVPGPAPESVDFVLIEAWSNTLTAPFHTYLKAQNVPIEMLQLRYVIAPVPRLDAFILGPETSDLVLFSAYRRKTDFPYNPLFEGSFVDIPRDWQAFMRPIRHVVCKEPATATEPVCWPFW